MHLIFLSGTPFAVSNVNRFFPIPVFSSEVNIYSAEMHSHIEFFLSIVYGVPGLVFDCKVELGMLWHAASRAVHRASRE